jgi:hypothetical protein
MDRNGEDAASRLPLWLHPQVQRVVAIADIAFALFLLSISLYLQARGYEPAGPFGLGPFWVVPAVMLGLGVALLRGFGVPRRGP